MPSPYPTFAEFISSTLSAMYIIERERTEAVAGCPSQTGNPRVRIACGAYSKGLLFCVEITRALRSSD